MGLGEVNQLQVYISCPIYFMKLVPKKLCFLRYFDQKNGARRRKPAPGLHLLPHIFWYFSAHFWLLFILTSALINIDIFSMLKNVPLWHHISCAHRRMARGMIKTWQGKYWYTDRTLLLTQQLLLSLYQPSGPWFFDIFQHGRFNIVSYQPFCTGRRYIFRHRYFSTQQSRVFQDGDGGIPPHTSQTIQNCPPQKPETLQLPLDIFRHFSTDLITVFDTTSTDLHIFRHDFINRPWHFSTWLWLSKNVEDCRKMSRWRWRGGGWSLFVGCY